MEKYETIEQLGEGAFAVVTKGKDLNTGSIVAIKKLKKKYQTWQECVDLREVKSLNVLKKQDNIIKLKEMIRVEDTLYLVFEYMEKNLLELIIGRQAKKLSEGQIRCVMWQTLQGLAYMHKYGFFHRDLKPENLLVNGETVKIADFGLAREIRSLPPYTDYVSTRYYRAPECIMKSTNYNSPIDIWALGCIMIEMYNQKPIFVGNSEKEVLFRMCSVLGTPTITSWPEGVQMAKKIDLKFPTSAGVSLAQTIPEAGKEALDFLSCMLKWDPNKRSTASDLLQHPFFTKFPTPTRINTPDYSNTNQITGKNVKTYSNVSQKHPHPTLNDSNNGNNLNVSTNKNKKDETDFSRLLNDTKGFNEFIQKIKNEKIEEDMKFIENKNCSPIAKKIDDEFDFDLPIYFKDNKSIIDNKTLYSNNNLSLLNANVSNITGMGTSLLTMTTNLNNQNQTQQTIYNYNKNFFDTTTLNNINGGGSRQGSGGSGSHGSNDKDVVDVPGKENQISSEDLFNMGRRKNLNNNGSNPGNYSEVINTETNKEIEGDINNFGNNNASSGKKKPSHTDKKEMDFDNCNVYLKPNPTETKFQSRKNSAFKFIENTMDKSSPSSTNNLLNSVKSTKDPINDKIGSQFNSVKLNPNTNSNNNNNNGFTFKNTLTSTNALNNHSSEKKQEYQSRRKNMTNNILSDLDNPRVVDININSNLSNKVEIDKSNVGYRKNNVGNVNANSDSGFGIFNSRRHVANATSLNTLGSNINVNSNPVGLSRPPKDKVIIKTGINF